MRTLGTAVICVLATAGLAAAAGDARKCHPDPPGTRSLTLRGEVTRYAFAPGGDVTVSVRTNRCSDEVHWDGASVSGSVPSCREQTAVTTAHPATRLLAAQ